MFCASLWLFVALFLKLQPQLRLEGSISGLCADISKRRAGAIDAQVRVAWDCCTACCRRVGRLRVIEHIGSIQPELQPFRLADFDAFGERGIESPEPRQLNHILPQSTAGSGTWILQDDILVLISYGAERARVLQARCDRQALRILHLVILSTEIVAVRFPVVPEHLAVTVEVTDDIRNTVRIKVI